MPNPKVGTVTPDVAGRREECQVRSGALSHRKAGIIHAQIGRANFETTALKENLLALVADLQKIKPATSKGIYLKKLTVSSTMGRASRRQASLDWVKDFFGRGRFDPVEGCAKRMRNRGPSTPLKVARKRMGIARKRMGICAKRMGICANRMASA